LILKKGEMVFELVEANYTWDKIFKQVSAQINTQIEVYAHAHK
jgi:hypothetical protein